MINEDKIRDDELIRYHEYYRRLKPEIDTVKKECVICPHCGARNHAHYIEIILNNDSEVLECQECNESFRYDTENVPLYTTYKR